MTSIAPGYRHAVIHPRLDRGTATVTATYDSMQGRFEIHSQWRDDAYQLSVLIPPNSTATVYVPCSAPDTVHAYGVQPVRSETDCAVYELPSGKYDFTSVLH